MLSRLDTWGELDGMNDASDRVRRAPERAANRVLKEAPCRREHPAKGSWAALVLLCGACGSVDGPSDMGSGGQSSTGGSLGESGGASAGGQHTGGQHTGGQNTGGGSASGGSSSGGQAADGGAGGSSSGGSDSGGSSSGGSGGQTDPCLGSTEAMLPTVARSATFSGTDSEYSELYDQLCVTKDDCVAPCTERGGTEEFCAEHVCVDSTDDYCLPPTKWRSVTNALEEDGTQIDSAESSLDAGTVGFQDRLVLEGFGFDVPTEAAIVGVTARVLRAYSSTEPVVDYSVRLVWDGEEVGTDLKRPDVWPEEVLAEAEYGGATELWGVEWSREQIMSESFGIAIGALPLTGGRAYIDVVRLVVHYDLCE